MSNTLTGLEALALSASNLEHYLKGIKESKGESTRKVLAEVLHNINWFNASMEYTQEHDMLYSQQVQLFGGLFHDIEKLLGMSITGYSDPSQIVKARFGEEGLQVWKVLKSLGYQEYNVEIWRELVAHLTKKYAPLSYASSYAHNVGV